MKKFVLSGAVAAALMLAVSKVDAASGGNLVLNISGTVEYQFTNSDVAGKAKTVSFNNATIYNMISNAVAHAIHGATNLPAKGIIKYDPEDSDGRVTGFFYVTDKTNGFFYALSGYDVNSVYYSYMELDSDVITAGPDLELGFDSPFPGSASYKLNTSGNGSLSGKDTALLYIHDSPYVNNLLDNPGSFYGGDTDYGPEVNEEVLEIQGILTINLTYKTDSINTGTISLTGTGVAKINGTEKASVISGHASIQ